MMSKKTIDRYQRLTSNSADSVADWLYSLPAEARIVEVEIIHDNATFVNPYPDIYWTLEHDRTEEEKD